MSGSWRKRACLVLTVLLLLAVPVSAQQSSETDKRWSELNKLSWRFGPFQGAIAQRATITIPEDYVFLGPVDTGRFMTLMGNLPRTDAYTFAPDHLKWFALFDFDESGYVKDDEAIDADAILQALKEGNARGNEERKKQGVGALYLEGWFVAPHYDVQTKRLEWATRLRSDSGEIMVNYNIRLLGRSGVMNAMLVSVPRSLEKDTAAFKAALTGFSFDAGERYSEFRSGDKIAEYGLTGLIVGGAAVAAAKSGLFKMIGKFGIWVIVGIGAVLFGVLRRKFGSRQKAT